MGKGAVVVFSGGIDSTTLLHYVRRDYDEVYGISFYYGQRHKKELQYAIFWGEELCKEHKIVNISFMREVANRSALMSDGSEIPKDQHYARENQRITVVPNRNMVLLSIAIAWAENLGIPCVFYGAHRNDFEVYPDCRPEFVEALSRASSLGTYTQVKVLAPFVNMTKAEIVKLGLKLGVDYSLTWSCYEGGERPCLRCATCAERTFSFLENGVKDPLLTDDEWERAVEICRKVFNL
ncbi:7-cyano-7-deazaguanine synthase QueC [Candidatus Bathyarchaeota archaeon]|nr:MAG: 7-cyano-7-deazaguanine synthase QueC [Candidatus Bathyarchaeota archaeon]